MNDVTLVHIIPRDRLILLELHSSLLVLLLVVLDPERYHEFPEYGRGRSYSRRGNLNVDASSS